MNRFFRLFCLIACIVYSSVINAYDFEVDGIYYNIISNNEAEVTYKTYNDKGYSGMLSIPKTITYEGVVYNVTSIGENAFNFCTDLIGSLIIPNSVTSIGNYAFYNCSGFTGSLAIPNSVKTIGERAFSGCSGLTGSLIIPNSVTIIGPGAFGSCRGFTGSLTIPNSVTSISDFAFGGCSGLTGSLIIPNSVTSISDHAFNGCSGLTGLLTIPNSVKSIGNFAFYECSGFTGSLIIPNSVTSIGNYAFMKCSGLTGSLIIPNSVTSISDFAFNRCSGLTGSLTIPNSVTYIGMYAFYGCSKIKQVVSEILSPFMIEDGVFEEISSNAILQVPKGTKDKYLTFPGWIKHFKEIVEDGGTVTPESESQLDGHEYVDLGLPSGKLWATTNYGASKPEDYGNYANWDGTDVISSSWGASWITPTLSDILELESNCSWIWETKNGINGYTVNGKNGNSIFLPAAGVKTGKVYHVGEWVYYWTSTKDTQYDDMNYIILSTASDVHWGSQNVLYSQLPIRPVSKDGKVVPPTTYTLSITASGNGSASYDGTTIRSKTSSFTVNEGTSATITFTPDNGYRIKSVIVNGSVVTVSNNKYTISSISGNTTVSVEFEAIPITTYTLSITASGNGSASYNSTTIRSATSSFTVNEGTTAIVTFTPDNGYRIKSVKLNSTDVTSYVSNKSYTISNITKNSSLEVEFAEELTTFTSNDINYSVSSYDDKTVIVGGDNNGIVLDVPAKVNFQNVEWTVIGIETGSLANNSDLAAIIWRPEAVFTEQVNNPNLLLYVNNAQYAPSSIKNVVVNGSANSITLTDAVSGNNFYCPQAFTAQRISYTHNYEMTTGIGEAKGWETIALPFDVQKVTHQSKGEIVSFANWKSGDAKKPFWLMQLNGSGWTLAESIKANTPYIISMPNNPEYKSGFLLNGNVTFSAENVTIPKTEDMTTSNYSNRAFVPTFKKLEKGSDVYALNVVNGLEQNTDGASEGSRFVQDLRSVHPFEAYMTTTASTRSISIDEGMATGIMELIYSESNEDGLRIYNLNGQMMMKEEGRNQEEVMKELPSGVYIINGKKLIIK